MFSCCHPWNKLKITDDSLCWRHEAAFGYLKETRENSLGQWVWDILGLILHRTAWALNTNQIKRWLHWGGLESRDPQWNHEQHQTALSGAQARNSHINSIEPLPSLRFSSKKDKDNHATFNGLAAFCPIRVCWQSCLSRNAVASDIPGIIGS